MSININANAQFPQIASFPNQRPFQSLKEVVHFIINLIRAAKEPAPRSFAQVPDMREVPTVNRLQYEVFPYKNKFDFKGPALCAFN